MGFSSIDLDILFNDTLRINDIRKITKINFNNNPLIKKNDLFVDIQSFVDENNFKQNLESP
jgi:hypothetical protein